jgi:hypothetical protein
VNREEAAVTIQEPAEAEPATRTLRTLLDAAGLPASDAEVAALVDQYPAMRAGVDALYLPPAARYVDPALRFRADVAPISDWG